MKNKRAKEESQPGKLVDSVMKIVDPSPPPLLLEKNISQAEKTERSREMKREERDEESKSVVKREPSDRERKPGHSPNILSSSITSLSS